MPAVIQNSLGRKIDLRKPTLDDIDITDIAHSLSLVCRFGGHIKHFYSVAEHSILVAKLLSEQGAPGELVLAGLLHDAHEAYLGDVTTPVKDVLREHGAYDDLVHGFDQHIAHYAGILEEDLHDAWVKAADEQALFIEAYYLMPAGLEHFHTPGVDVPTAAESSTVEQFSRHAATPSRPYGCQLEFMAAWNALTE